MEEKIESTPGNLAAGNKSMDVYAIELCVYSDENVPECGATVFVKSAEPLHRMPLHIVRDTVFEEESIKSSGYDGIMRVYKIAECALIDEEDPWLIEL